MEHNPQEIWENTCTVIELALSRAQANHLDIAAIGVTNQRESTIVWDKNTGEPVYNAIVWQDTRTQDIVNRLAGDGGPDRFRCIVGETLSTYASITKLMWILETLPRAREKALAGDLLFGNPDTWLIWNLTGGVNGGHTYHRRHQCFTHNADGS